ncbi:hypothetical protein FRC09_011517 [Ceratobasidium sp. 395]|nr:hypothetical protein FRC09_011517 [Ceratobasidium sp. 395]
MSAMDVDPVDTSKAKDGKKPRFEVKKALIVKQIKFPPQVMNAQQHGVYVTREMSVLWITENGSCKIEDEERKGLFYHPLDGNLYALSFLSERPASRNSATVIGLVPEGQGLDGFEENQAFVDLLHDTVKAALTDNVDPDLGNDATQRQEGWMHVHDMRRFPESGRVGDADDIIGSVLVQKGKIKGETYERMPSYRTCTGDGPIKLSSSVHERLMAALKDAHKKESKA